jgi:integrase
VSIYDPATKGKRWVGTYPTQRDAKRAEAEATLHQRQAGGTIAAYENRWLGLHPRKRSSTMIHYRDRLRPFVKEFGKRQLGSISKLEAREWALEHRSAHGPVRAMYADAIRDGLISENPFSNLRLQQSRGRRDLDVMSEDEVRHAIQVAGEKYGPNFAAYIATAAYCGLRPGELYALTWACVDFDENELHVKASYSSKSGETTAPKNDHQRRPVLFPEARDMLLRVPRSDGPVFRTITGKPMSGRVQHFYWDPVRTAIGRPQESFYSLRHYCAWRLLNVLGHEAEDVAFQLGHTDGGVLIRRLYGHPSEELARERLKAGLGRKVVPVDFRRRAGGA